MCDKVKIMAQSKSGQRRCKVVSDKMKTTVEVRTKEMHGRCDKMKTVVQSKLGQRRCTDGVTK